MTKQFVKPDPDCALCHGDGEVSDSVDYGDTQVSLPSFCDCVEIQVPDYEDIEIVLVLGDVAMYQITITVVVRDAFHDEYVYFFGTLNEANEYGANRVAAIWSDAAELGKITPLEHISAMTPKGEFNFQPIGWRIK